MNKTDAGLLGASLVILAIFIYGMKYNMGWKYWVLTLLFLPGVGAVIGGALGQEDEEANKFAKEQLAIELCRSRECNDKGGSYTDGRCYGADKFSVTNGYPHSIKQPISLDQCSY